MSRSLVKKITALITAVFVSAELAAPAAVFAAAGTGVRSPEQIRSSFIRKGSYQYTTSAYKLNTDSFRFDEECFRESSFKGCSDLVLLSTQAANASTPYHSLSRIKGKYAWDRFGRNMSSGSTNVEGLLSKMGFSNIKVNTYYNKLCLENSVGIAIGSRNLTVRGKKYTLIALFPRSDGYHLEWAGNFKVGKGDLHQGFKEARDEGLRFLKWYLNKNKISGNIKVWVAGHSRGAAIANMIGGFLAGGGAAYFGSGIRLAPQDVYCYTTATPSVIKDGALKNDELSVSGPRGGEYADDTKQSPYKYTGGGRVDLSSEDYSGIRNYMLDYDLITFLPPAKWGFRRYGSDLMSDHDGDLSEEDMLVMLEKLNPERYERFINGKRKKDFKWKKLNISKMKIEDDDSVQIELRDFVESRVISLMAYSKNNEDYVNNGSQDALVTAASLFGILYEIMIKRAENNLVNFKDAASLTLVYRINNTFAEERKQYGQNIPGGSAPMAPTQDEIEANEALYNKLDNMIAPAIEQARTVYGDEYYNRLLKYMQDMKVHINEMRRLVSYMLFYTEGESYDQTSSLRTATTLIGNFGLIVETHFKEANISWAKARNNAFPSIHDTGEAMLMYQQSLKAVKKAQKLTVKVSKKKIKATKLKKRARKVSVLKVSGAHGKVTYKKKSGSSVLKINKKTGAVTVKRRTRNGKYRMRVLISASGDSKFKKASVTRTITIRVK